ncbi:MAG: hypothetical protein DWQ36_20165 [Acidobacteria bacterium]|nr:MAG: hypothetical protein DWQ30_10120 [Acidobacteriota bacterium]REK03184.1 MAG: hypothetical protein DWQ36_20165 [Acidobacteriota bacterium]
MSTFLAILGFLLVHGASTVLWTVGGMLLGAAAGVVLVWALRWPLAGARRRRPFAFGVIALLLAVSVLPLLTFAGGFFGGAHAARRLMLEQTLLEETAQLGFDGAERALVEARARLRIEAAAPPPPPDVAEPAAAGETPASDEPSALLSQVELALRLVEGEERFPVDSLGELTRSFSDGALRRALKAYESGHSRLGERGAPTWIARGLGQRLLSWMIERPREIGDRWTEPVAADLRARPENADGLATGRELALGIVRVHLQRPMARWTWWAVAVNAWVLVAIAAGLLLTLPPLVLAFARLVRPLPRDSAAPDGLAVSGVGEPRAAEISRGPEARGPAAE